MITSEPSVLDGRVVVEPDLRTLARADTVPVAVLAWLAGLWVAVITSTPYLADDGLNKDLRATAIASGDTLLDLIVRYTSQWMTTEGRFFPGSLAWSYGLFWFTGSALEYKLVVGAVLVVAVALVCLLAARLTGRWKVAAVLGVLTLGCLQLRLTNDGTAAYAGLLPLTIALSAGAVLVLVSRRGWLWSVLAAVLYAMALVTYETVILFLPVMVAAVVVTRRSWRPAVALVVPALVQACIVLALRAGLENAPAPGYTIRLSPAEALPTLAKQMLAAVPLSQHLLRDGTVPPVSMSTAVIALLVAGVPAFVGLRVLARSVVVVRPVTIVLLAGGGLWIWGASAALVAVTARWQAELRLGQGYLPVVYGYVGLALCLLAAWLAIERSAVHAGARARMLWSWAGPGAGAVLVTVTLTSNILTASAL